jgi:anti-sigma regulatory factor (Ser/Thr protein kinase)
MVTSSGGQVDDTTSLRARIRQDNGSNAPVRLTLTAVDSAGVGRQAAPGVRAWADDAFALLTGLPGVHRVGLALVEGGGRRLRFTASDRDAGPDLDWCDVDGYDDVPLNTAVRTSQPVIGVLDELGDRYPAYAGHQRETPTVALAAVPIVAAGQTIGGYLLLFDGSQGFDRRQRLELARIGRELGASLRRARRAERSRRRRPAGNEQVPPGARAATHEVAGDPAAVAGARTFLRQTLRDWGVDGDVADNATLCLSELVTNAVIHSHDGCLVRVVLHDGKLTTTVLSWGTQNAASVESVADPLQVHGRGLQVVDALAGQWGHEPHHDGASVWFSMDL